MLKFSLIVMVTLLAACSRGGTKTAVTPPSRIASPEISLPANLKELVEQPIVELAPSASPDAAPGTGTKSTVPAPPADSPASVDSSSQSQATAGGVLANKSCAQGKILRGFDDQSNPICESLPALLSARLRVRHGYLTDAVHHTYLAECDPDEAVVGGYCQCHASATWISGRYGNGWSCACDNPATADIVSVLAYCVR